jgi:hypothetical protein
MRAFFAACFVAIVISIGAMAVLDQVVQEPVSAAFATSAVRN